MNLLRDILPVLDNIERAIEASESTTDVETLREGFRMTASQIEKLLKAMAVKQSKQKMKFLTQQYTKPSLNSPAHNLALLLGLQAAATCCETGLFAQHR